MHVLVNPEIIKSEGEHLLDEGCLSVPGYWGKVRRAERVTVKARDAFGKEIRITAAEPMANLPRRLSIREVMIALLAFAQRHEDFDAPVLGLGGGVGLLHQRLVGAAPFGVDPRAVLQPF